jgi:hypothetical protein
MIPQVMYDMWINSVNESVAKVEPSGRRISEGKFKLG